MKVVTKRDYQERIMRVLLYLERHLDDAISLEDLARIACFSPYHFHRIFRGMVGEPVMEYLRRLRLDRAAQRLKYTTQPVTQVAFSAGYETHEAFTRAFSGQFGMPPSQFRQTQGPRSSGEPVSVTVETVSPVKTVFLRHVGPYDAVGETWGRLMNWAGARGLIAGMPVTVGVVLDDPEVTPPEKIRYDACLAVSRDVTPEGEFGVQEIPGGEYAVMIHRGPYNKLNETYARLCGEWLPSSGREPAERPAWERYRNAPQFTSPEDLLTDIYLPLE